MIQELGLGGSLGVRLDSGDLGALAVRARRLLDAAGLGRVRIVASGGLDEDAIAALVAGGAPIDAYGVGTKMGTSADAPYLDSAYKLVAYNGRPVTKLSPGKGYPPGAKQVFRGPAADGDLVGLRKESAPAGRAPLLAPVMVGGRRVGSPPGLGAARERFEADLAWLPERARALREPEPVPVLLTERLDRLHHQVQADLARRAGSTPTPIGPPTAAIVGRWNPGGRCRSDAGRSTD